MKLEEILEEEKKERGGGKKNFTNLSLFWNKSKTRDTPDTGKKNSHVYSGDNNRNKTKLSVKEISKSKKNFSLPSPSKKKFFFV